MVSNMKSSSSVNVSRLRKHVNCFTNGLSFIFIILNGEVETNYNSIQREISRSSSRIAFGMQHKLFRVIDLIDEASKVTKLVIVVVIAELFEATEACSSDFFSMSQAPVLTQAPIHSSTLRSDSCSFFFFIFFYFYFKVIITTSSSIIVRSTLVRLAGAFHRLVRGSHEEHKENVA